MSKSLQVRDVPDDAHAELRRRAATAGMSLSDFTRQELSRLARRPSLGDQWLLTGSTRSTAGKSKKLERVGTAYVQWQSAWVGQLDAPSLA